MSSAAPPSKDSLAHASDFKILGAVLIDMIIVWGIAVPVGYGLIGLTENVAVKVLYGIIVAFVVPMLYGMFCFVGHTVGTLCMGTQIVKEKDGSIPGTLGGMQMMLFRTVIGWLMPLILLGSLFDGGGTPDLTLTHTSIDKKGAKAPIKE